MSGGRTLVRGGLVVTAAEELYADVLVEGSRIAALAAHGSACAAGWTADRTIDATGRYVVPGGVDVHTHLDLPFAGSFSADTFAGGTRAAAWGGTTTVVDFAVQTRGRPLREGLDLWHARADGRCAVDYSFHMVLTDVRDATLAEMDLLVEEGITSFRTYMTHPEALHCDDGQILRAMQRTAADGALLMVHAENGPAVDVLTARALAEGRTAPRHHAGVRPPELEAEAVHRAVRLAEVAGAPLYVVHVSARQAAEEVAAARGRGLPVYGETCPQYLHLTSEELDRPGFEGAKYVCTAPLRPPGHQEALWRALRTGDLQVVSSDHCPFDFAGQKEMGRGDFSRIPAGLPGVEHRLDLLHQGVVEGRISRRRWIELACAAPARMFGLAGRKGTLAPGADADVVVYDPSARHTLSAAAHHMDVDYSAYEGLRVTGRAETVLLRGEPVVRGGEYTGRAGQGRFLPRGASPCPH
ncbi:dihydropyrimidinase [Streptomyces desertarenae]|uniref:Dihydropyrimidinase n=1 Tax=Streptomyces desertarenae TaxID=2666184 RepID=A0ABW4PL78_9ACTN